METALKVRLSRANDQFIFYSPMVVYSVLDNYYITYYIIFVLFFKQTVPITLLVDLKYI